MFQQGEIDSIGDRVALTEDPGDFRRLPVDDARQDLGSGSCRLSGALGLTMRDCPPPGISRTSARRFRPRLSAEARKDGSLAYKITPICLVGVDPTVVSPAAILGQEHSFPIPNTKA